jgi:hypothetical protein
MLLLLVAVAFIIILVSWRNHNAKDKHLKYKRQVSMNKDKDLNKHRITSLFKSNRKFSNNQLARKLI